MIQYRLSCSEEQQSYTIRPADRRKNSVNKTKTIKLLPLCFKYIDVGIHAKSHISYSLIHKLVLLNLVVLEASLPKKVNEM